jgi:hypothetical protein
LAIAAECCLIRQIASSIYFYKTATAKDPRLAFIAIDHLPEYVFGTIWPDKLFRMVFVFFFTDPFIAQEITRTCF